MLPWVATSLPTWVRNWPGFGPDAQGWNAVVAFVVATASFWWRLRGKVSDRLKRFRGLGRVLDLLLGALVVVLLVSLSAALIDLAAAIRTKAPGTSVSLTVLRDGKTRSVTVELADGAPSIGN